MAKVVFLDPLGYADGSSRHRHFVRDWTGASLPGYIPFPPLDLMYAAAYLRKYGYDSEIIEANVKHFSEKQILMMVKEKEPDFIVLPTTFFTLNYDKHLASRIKADVKDIKIIFAGPSVTHAPEMVLSDNSADFVALGELELPVLNILQEDYSQNIAYRHDGRVIRGARTLVDLKELPVPARDLIDNQAYRYAIFNKKNPVTAMTISRGCPHSKCEFCHSNIYTLKQQRYRDINSIASEIEEIVSKYRIGEIFFRDQTFTANRGLVIQICEFILSHNIDISWRIVTRADLLDKELLTLMYKAGCFQISFGFESPSQQALDMINKGFTVEQSRRAAKMAKEAGMEVVGLFIYGLPGESEESIKEIYKFALELGVDYANFNVIYPVAGTAFYEKYIAGGSRLLPEKLLKKYVINANLKFNLRPRYFFKQLSKIKSFSELRFLIRAGLNEVLFNL
jgi:anaerobic magnesium-protoporphyrin IX monomethyl ester cyclase